MLRESEQRNRSLNDNLPVGVLRIMPSGEAVSTNPTLLQMLAIAEDANGLEPYSYLRCLFENLPLVKDQDGYRDLLPQNIDPELIISSRA